MGEGGPHEGPPLPAGYRQLMVAGGGNVICFHGLTIEKLLQKITSPAMAIISNPNLTQCISQQKTHVTVGRDFLERRVLVEEEVGMREGNERDNG